MTPLEILVCVLGIPFFIVEVYQLYMLRKSQQRLTCIWEKVLEDPEYAGKVVENAVLGFMDRVAVDKKSQDAFFGFLQVCGVNVMEGLRAHFTKEGRDAAMPFKWDKKDPMGSIIQMFGPALMNSAKKGATEAAESVITGWG